MNSRLVSCLSFVVSFVSLIFVPLAYATTDTIYVNSTVVTVDAENRVAQALAIAGETIQAVGSNEEIRALATADTRVVDLAGKTITPGFIDAHSHLAFAGEKALFQASLDPPPIGTVKTVADAIVALTAKAEKTPLGQWVTGMGYDDTLLAEKRHLTRQDLDKVSTRHPVWALHISGHFGVANSMALQLAAITKDTPQPSGGIIRKDEATGEPSGILEEQAMLQVMKLIPPPTLENRLVALRAAAADYARHGITTAQNGLTDERSLNVFQEVEKSEALPIRVVVWPDFATAQKMIDGGLKVDWSHSHKLKLGAAKTFADGSIQGYTGYLTQPYHSPFHGDPAYRGYPIMPREQLTELVTTLHKAGFQLAIHGNGDAAIDDLIAAYRQAQQVAPRADARPIIIHAQMARDDQLDATKELGMIPSFFVLHTYYWGDRHRDLFLGPQRAARISPTRSALDRGIPFTIHTDTPVVPMEPLRLMWAAVNRLSTGGKEIGPEQRIGPLDALRAITIDAARQYFQERTLGSLEPGKLADFVILSANPLTQPATIKDIEVLETVVGGKTVYKKGE